MPTATETRETAVFPFKLGADPEYTVLSGTRPMEAREVLQTFIKDVRATNMGYDFEGGNIGWDGHAATGELRPKPGQPEEVVKNIKGMFKEVASRIPFIELTTLTVAGPTGGHIHLEVPRELSDMAANNTPKWQAMQRALATFSLLIMAGENPLSREMRKRGGSYGNLMDFRVERKFNFPDGAPGYTVEVRCPTAEWITTERIALGTLAYMAIAWDSILKGSSALKPIAPILFRSRAQADASLAPFLSNWGGFQKLYLNKMRPFIRKHPMYAQYKDVLELVMSPERTLAEKKAAHYSVSEGWGIATHAKQIPATKFLKDEDVEEKAQKFPESIIRNISQFAWNDDLNVQAFASALSKRCIAFGWKPQHEYFLFGLKNGINSIIVRDETGEFVAGHEVMATKKDAELIAKKFDRLKIKAAPSYGRFIHPRTGEMASADDLRRVMIGIPYAMRQKMDIKPLMRLVLKFEKNPKAFSALNVESLPEGASPLQEAIEQEEQIERSLEIAAERGDQRREVADATVVRMQEEQESDALIANAPSHVATAIYRAAHRMFGRMWSNYVNMPGSAEHNTAEFVRLAMDTTELGNGAVIGPADIRATVASQLASAMAELHANTQLDYIDALYARQGLAVYLALNQFGQRGRVSMNLRNWSHLVRWEDGAWILETLASNGEQTVDGAIITDPQIITDLMGISNPAYAVQAQQYIRRLENNPSARMTVGLGNVIAGTCTTGSSRIISNPDPALPHLWSASNA